MIYTIEIVQYQGKIYKGDQCLQEIGHVSLRPQEKMTIKGASYTLEELVRVLLDYKNKKTHPSLSERGMLKQGQYLYKQTLGKLEEKNLKALYQQKEIEIRIVSQDEFIARLPWVLLADLDGVFRSVAGWSVSLARTREFKNYELPPSPRMLIMAPQPKGEKIGDTKAPPHLKELESILSDADPFFSQGRNLRITDSWEESKKAIKEFSPQVIYYYGHGLIKGPSSALHFVKDDHSSSVAIPLIDFSQQLSQAPQGPPLIAYINCCYGDAGGLLGAGWQLGNTIPVVVTNRTVANIKAAQIQGLNFWQDVLLKGFPPHKALSRIHQNLVELGMTIAEPKWMTPVLHATYAEWKSNPPKRDQAIEDPNWRYKLDRITQYGVASYLVSQMIREQKPRSLAFVWYGKEGQGVDLFHDRLNVELQENLPETAFYTVQPDWPDITENLHASFRQMLLRAFKVVSLENIPGRIREQTGGVSRQPVLVYVCHEPVRSKKLFNPKMLKSYLEWWDQYFVPLLEENVYALLGVSFVVEKPDKFYEALEKAKLDDIPLSGTVYRPLDEMVQVVKKDLLDFVRTHNVRLLHSRRDEILENVLKKTKGNYEKIIEELEDLAHRAWAVEEEPTGKEGEEEEEDY